MGNVWCAMCILSKSFLWDSTKESFCRFFWAKTKQPIVLYCIASVVKEMEKLDGF